MEPLIIFGFGVGLGYLFGQRHLSAEDRSLLDLGRAIGADVRDVMFKRKVCGDHVTVETTRGARSPDGYVTICVRSEED